MSPRAKTPPRRSRAARTPTPVTIDEDEEDAEDETGEDPEDEPGDLDELIAGENQDDMLERALREDGAREVLLTIFRQVQGRGEVALPSIRIPIESFDEYRDTIIRAYGGTDPDGSYRVIFKTRGAYRGTRTFQAGGPPLPVRHRQPGETDAPPTTAAPSGIPVTPALTLEAVAELLESRLAKQREADEVDRLRRELADLKANGGATSKTGVADMVGMVFDRTKELTGTMRKATDDSPEAKALRDRLDKLEAENDRLRKKDDDRREEAQAARDRRLFKLLARKKKPKKSPMSPILSALIEANATDAMISKLTHRVDEGEGGDYLAALLSYLKPEAEKYGKKVIRSLGRQLEEANAVAPKKPAAEQGAIDPQAWAAWVTAIMNAPALVQDREHVRKGLVSFGPHMRRMIAVHDKAALVAFVRETLSDQTADAFNAAPDADMARILQMLDALRDTVVAIAAEPQPSPAASSDAEDDDDEDDDEAETVEGTRVS